MARLNSFTFISLNGFYKGPHGDIDWHRHGAEEAAYSAASLQANNILLFGRATYEMMAKFWPTPMAYEAFPLVADAMNKAEKIVVSRNLKSITWKNTSLLSYNLVEKIKELKQGSTKNLTLLGSGTVLTQLAEANLVDEYQLMIDPTFLTGGTPILNQLKVKIDLKLTKSQSFNSGSVLVCYEPI